MPSLDIRLLGEFRVLLDGGPVRGIDSARLQALLAYLVIHRDAHQSRQHLAFLLWPDSSEPQARTNLRHLLHGLRKALPDADRYLRVDAKMLQWVPDAGCTCDVVRFEDAAVRAGAAGIADADVQRVALEEAANAYGGDFLPASYDEWTLAERERLRGRFAKTLESLVGCLEDRRDYGAAIRWAERLLQHDPLREATYRGLMRLYALSGDRARALRVYHVCASTLQRELGVEPGLPTRDVYERVLRGASTPSEEPAGALAPGTALVGRQEEWNRVRQVWRDVERGRAQLLVISGEAGIGKTRLAEELRTWSHRQGIETSWAACYAAGDRLAYAPVGEWLRSAPLRTAFAALDEVWLVELARILPELRAEHADLPEPEPLSEDWQRQRLFESLTRAVAGSPPQRQPLLLFLDDAQWCDRESLDWIGYLLRSAPGAPILVTATVRVEEAGEEHPLSVLALRLKSVGRLVRVELGPLTCDEVGALASQAAGDDVDAAAARRLYEETEGNPLFVVETVRAGTLIPTPEPIEVEGPTRVLPSRVLAVLHARLTQLSGPARELAGMAATIGRAFTFDVLARAADLEENEIVRSLDEMWRRRIVRAQGADAWDFSHDKLREVAYAELGPARRRLLHRRVAQALESVHAVNLDAVSGRIAMHYDMGGRPDLAVPLYQRAAERAIRLYANDEAVALLRRALALVQGLPEDRSRIERELVMRIAIGVPLVALEGYAAPEVQDTYTRAVELCRLLGRPPGPPVLRALAIAAVTRSEPKRAYEFGEQLLARAGEERDPVLSVESNYVLGVARFWLGDFADARQRLEEAISSYDRSRHSTHVALYSQDPGVVCGIRLAYALWFLGFPEQAARLRDQSLALARELAHPYSLAYALNFACWLSNELGDRASTQSLVAEAGELTTEQRLSLLRNMNTVMRGWLQVESGELADGIGRIREGLAAAHATGQDLYRPYALGLLARALARSGGIEEGMVALDEALDFCDRTDERFWEAELYRLRGDLLLEGKPPDEAEADGCYLRALRTARRQGAHALELRAAVSRLRLSRRPQRARAKPEVARAEAGTAADAEPTLGEILAAFTEGLGTQDLREARELLGAETG